MTAVHHTLLSATPGTSHQLLSLHYGQPGAGPKVMIQASLHADEVPGMLVAHHLRQRLDALQAQGRVRGEVVLVPAANPVGQGLGHFFGAMRVDAFRPAAEFKADMDNWIATFRAARATPGQRVLIPGDPERETAAVRLLDGIPLLEPVLRDLESLGQKFGVPL